MLPSSSLLKTLRYSREPLRTFKSIPVSNNELALIESLFWDPYLRNYPLYIQTEPLFMESYLAMLPTWSCECGLKTYSGRPGHTTLTFNKLSVSNVAIDYFWTLEASSNVIKMKFRISFPVSLCLDSLLTLGGVAETFRRQFESSLGSWHVF